MRKKANEKLRFYFSNKLKRHLVQIPYHPLTIVEAPSGFGKTTAIREHLKGNLPPDACEYWYTCLGEPESMAWRGICDLLANVNGEIAANLKKIQMPTVDTLLYVTSILRDFQCQCETYLVVDNYQLVNCDIPRELISVFSMHGSPNLHIIFITQQLGPRQQFSIHNPGIYTIDASAFFFDREGTESLFRMEGIRLSDDELNKVYMSTEGWVSAIRLHIIQYEETGSLDYTYDIEKMVETAIWNRLMPEEKEFLISVGVMDSFSSHQAAMMINQETLPGNIKELLHSSDFIRYYPDKGIYIIHNILQEFLRNHFYNYKPRSFQSKVLRRAGAALAAVEEYGPAAMIFYNERDFESLLELPLTSEYLIEQKEKYQPGFIEMLIETCPEEILIKYPFKILLYGFQKLLLGKYKTYQKICKLIAYIIYNNTDLNPEDHRTLRGEYVLLRTYGESRAFGQIIEGYKKAWKILGKSSGIITASTPWPLGCSILNIYWTQSGELKNNLREMQENANLYCKLTGGYMCGADSIMWAEAMLMRGNDEEAEILCHKALYSARSYEQVSINICADLILARIAILRGDINSFFTAVRNLQNYANDYSLLYILRTAELCLTTISLDLDIFDYVANWFCDMESIGKVLYPITIFNTALMLYAKKLLLKKQYNEFYGLSQYAMEADFNIQYLMPKLYNLIFLAMANRSRGNHLEAQKYLKQALLLAMPDQIYLPFAQQEGMEDFLSELPANIFRHDKNVAASELSTLKELCRRQQKGAGMIKKAVIQAKSPLTPREREIANLAKSRLSAREIADELYISELTVRATLRSVYSKLDIHSKNELVSKEF